MRQLFVPNPLTALSHYSRALLIAIVRSAAIQRVEQLHHSRLQWHTNLELGRQN